MDKKGRSPALPAAADSFPRSCVSLSVSAQLREQHRLAVRKEVARAVDEAARFAYEKSAQQAQLEARARKIASQLPGLNDAARFAANAIERYEVGAPAH